MYDVVTSLGYNCEISFRLENYLSKIDAMPFSWSFETDREQLPLAIKNLDRLFTGEVKLQPDNMIACCNYGIKYHPRYDVLLRDGEVTEDSFREALEELRNRVEHLKDKFRNLLESDKNTLFFMKVLHVSDEEDCAYVKCMYDTLTEMYRSGRFTLVVLVEKDGYSEKLRALESDSLKIRKLKKFAPLKHTDTLGDVKGWFCVLNEFLADQYDGHYYKRLWKRRFHWFVERIKKDLRK